MDRIDEIAQENKCDYAILVSSSFRKGAHKFYEAVGFKTISDVYDQVQIPHVKMMLK